MPQSTKYILPVYGTLALYSLGYFSYTNGYIPLVMEKGQAWLNSPKGNPQKRPHTTGIESLDNPLSTMFVFYWPLLDGTSPGYSLVFFNYFGTIILSLVLGTLESLRRGNQTYLGSLLLSPTMWGMIGIMVTLALSLPWYLLIHLFISITASRPTKENLSIPVYELKALLVNVVVGLMLPCLLVALPERLTGTLYTRQTAIAMWQLWPFWSTAVHFVAKLYISTAERGADPKTHWQRTRAAFRSVYGFTFAVAAFTHLSTWAVSLTTAYVIPNLVSARMVSEFHPRTVFLNPMPWSSIKTNDVGEGTRWLIQWDQVFAAGSMFLWSLDMYRTALNAQGKTINWYCFAAKTLGTVMISGFTGATVRLLWKREEMFLEAGKPKEKSK